MIQEIFGKRLFFQPLLQGVLDTCMRGNRMSYVRIYGPPDLFITMTTNSK